MVNISLLMAFFPTFKLCKYIYLYIYIDFFYTHMNRNVYYIIKWLSFVLYLCNEGCLELEDWKVGLILYRVGETL